ncbi:MAG: ribulose-phosphate 3-epimerase [Promethearchaeota archaeon]
MKKVAVSIHATDNFNTKIIEKLEGFDYFHIDVMDGRFVDNKTDNLNVVHNIRNNYNTPIIAHLMVINPIEYFKKIYKFIDIFLFHFEINYDIDEILREVKRYNVKVGLAINPETPISKIVPFLSKIDLVLVMSVNPGWSGQEFLPCSIKKVNELSKLKENNNFLIDVDGGINLQIASLLSNTDILTSSSTILKAEDPNRIIKLLRESDRNG